MRPSQGSSGTGKNGIYIRGTGEQREQVKFSIFGEHGICFKGTRGQVPLLGEPQLCQGNSNINI